MEALIAVAVIGFVGACVTAVVGFLGGKRNNKGNNNLKTVRDECDQIKNQMHDRFNRREDQTGRQFDRLGDRVDKGFDRVVNVLEKIERKA